MTNVDKERVYLKLDIDFARGTFSYPYRWVPASGNLMYCMPEKGTRVALYCKSNDERNAVATNGKEILGAFLHVASDYNKRFFTTANKKIFNCLIKAEAAYEGQIIFRRSFLRG